MDSTPRDDIIVVDADDRVIGVGTKQAVHRLGLRHRAFSILLIDEMGRVLLQQRAPGKYHSGGLWANSCCGHPRPGEATDDAAIRRAQEELGVGVELRHAGTFTYRAAVGETLVEYEIDHVFVGKAIGDLRPDPREISAIRWMSVEEVRSDMRQSPARYAPWLDQVLSIALGSDAWPG